MDPLGRKVSDECVFWGGLVPAMRTWRFKERTVMLRVCQQQSLMRDSPFSALPCIYLLPPLQINLLSNNILTNHNHKYPSTVSTQSVTAIKSRLFETLC